MNTLLFIAALASLHLATLYKASNTLEASLIVSLLITSISLASVLYYKDKIKHFLLKTTIKSYLYYPLSYLLLFQAWVFFQYASGLSHDKNSTLNTFLSGCGISLLAICLNFFTKDKHKLRLLCNSILLVAVFQALYGIFNVASGVEHLLLTPKEYYIGKATGTFVNPNHYAAYLNLSIGIVVSTIFCNIANTKKTSKSKGFFSVLWSLKGLSFLILTIGVLYSKSMGAIFSLMVTLLLFPLVFAAINKNYWRQTLSITLTTTAILCFCLMATDMNTFSTELKGLQSTIERRIEISTASMSLIKEYWLTGSGGGTFYTVFPEHRTLDIGNAFYYHAHNDYVEFISDFGVIGGLLLFAFVGLCILENIKKITNRANIYQQTFAYASIFSTITVMLHSLVDFPLHTNAYAMLYVCIISVNCSSNLNNPNQLGQT